MLKNSVVTLDFIADACLELSYSEQLLLYLAIKKLPQESRVNCNFTHFVSVNDFIVMGVDADEASEQLLIAARHLLTNSVLVASQDTVLSVRWLRSLTFYNTKADYLEQSRLSYMSEANSSSKNTNKDNAVAIFGVGFVFSENLFQDRSNADWLYALEWLLKYLLFNQMKESINHHRERLLLLIFKHRATGQFTMTIDEFREAMRVVNSYNKIADLRRHVVENPINELNALTEYTIDYTFIRNGRYYEKITIAFHNKTPSSKKLRDPNTFDMFTGRTDL